MPNDLFALIVIVILTIIISFVLFSYISSPLFSTTFVAPHQISIILSSYFSHFSHFPRIVSILFLFNDSSVTILINRGSSRKYEFLRVMYTYIIYRIRFSPSPIIEHTLLKLYAARVHSSLVSNMYTTGRIGDADITAVRE